MRNPKPIVDSIAIIGVGLIGGSLALAIVKNFACRNLHLCDNSPAARRILKKLFINNTENNTTDTIAHIHNAPAKAVQNADIVIIAAPLNAYENILRKIAAALKPGAIVSDVGSVKQIVAKQFDQMLPEKVFAIPAHPVAGTEHSGAKNAFHKLFQNRYTIITPIITDNVRANSKTIHTIQKLWRKVGAKVISLSCEKHDDILATSSHMPHAIAYAIVLTALDSKNNHELSKLSAGGFRDFTRIAASSPTMWRDVFLANPEKILQNLQAFRKKLERIENAIAKNNSTQLVDDFQLAKKSRKDILAQGQAGVFIYNETSNNQKNKLIQ